MQARPPAARMAGTPSFWFPAKRYGWGWGPPVAWQGWAVLAVFVAWIGIGAVVFSPARHAVAFLLNTTSASLLLVAVCWWKGEPPRWRWGDPGDE